MIVVFLGNLLTIICPVEFSIIINWKSQILGVSSVLFSFLFCLE